MSIFMNDVDDLKTVDVLQMVANGLDGDVGLDEADDNVSCCPAVDSACNMCWQVVLSVIPVHLHLPE